MLFSAHGLPEKTIKAGDPYQAQVEGTVRAVIEKANEKDLKHIICYQSKIGPLKWIEPSTNNVIAENSKIGKHIV